MVSTFKRYYSLYKNIYGSILVLPLIECVSFGNKINFYKNALQFKYFMYVGSVLKFQYINILFMLSNIGLVFPKYATAMGTYAVVLKKTRFCVTLRLPSSQIISVTRDWFGILGRNAGSEKYKEFRGKASFDQVSGKISVRSVAKNPVDHPNGGRTRGKMCFKTPWGLVAKSNK